MEQMNLSNDHFEPQLPQEPARLARLGAVNTPDTTALSRPSERDPSAPVQGGNVTEIILPRAQVEHFQLLLPMLTQLTREERWLAWIDPPAALVQQWQQHQGIVQGQLLVLRSSGQHSAQSLAQRALAAGTCHAVILWTQGLSRQSFHHLEKASAQGNSHGIVLRQR
ncbi:MAG: SulA-like leucine-rich domain-containing protein [Oleiphilaceae bacterium]|nr:SulA-like leucine-rich domain-containing protein [Oleiphilaceae bacterium]